MLQSVESRPGPIWRWTLRFFLFAAAAISAYLLFVSLIQGGLPAGCGSGSGCAEVLTSRWSSVLGIPVSGPALLVYLTMLVTSFFISPQAPVFWQRWGWFLLVTLAFLTVLSAAWFIVLQHFVLNSVCAYCMAGHACGLASAAVIFLHMPRATNEPPRAAGSLTLPGGRHRLVLLASVFVAALVVLQLLIPGSSAKLARLPIDESADVGKGAERRISLLDGKLELAPLNEPLLGPVEAPRLLVLMFDYCCPHCRRTHQYLMNGFRRYSDQFAIIALPVPLNSDCNSTQKETQDRFQDACVLARLALAVWTADPTAFEEYDAWLFEPKQPRRSEEARQKAEQLVTSAELQRAESQSDIERRIVRNVEAYAESGAERIPVLMSPGFAAIVGRSTSAEELYEVLEDELGLKPVEVNRARREY